MKSLRLPKERVQTLDPETLEKYLMAHGWEADKQASSAEVGVYHSPAESEEEIRLPLSKGFIDYALRIGEVLEVVATAQKRTAWEVLEDVSARQAGSCLNGALAGRRAEADGEPATKKRVRR